MTKEDRAKLIKYLRYNQELCVVYVLTDDEVDEIVKALEQQPCEDCISRQAVEEMSEDRLNKTISNIAYILDSLTLLRQILNKGDCNVCKNKDCRYKPKLGQMVRYNCPFYKAEIEDGKDVE